MTLAVRRPILPGFNPDPSICRVDEDYYLACSSFEFFPGVPIYHSRDLIRWTHLTNALTRPDQLDVTKVPPSQGIYAPTLRHHDGLFWLITTNSIDTGSQVLLHARSADGPWSSPVSVSVAGIDPDLTWDDAGRCFLTCSALHPTTRSPTIVQVPLNADLTAADGPPVEIWAGTGGCYPEAPHLYRIGDWWYLVIAEGGTERGHKVTVARSREITGPFEGCPANPVLTMTGTYSQVQNTGHADLIERPDGSWAMVFLGVRTAGGTPGWHVLGRETFAAEVAWDDGWPVVTSAIEPAGLAEDRSWDFCRLSELGPEWFSPQAADLSFAHLDVHGLTLGPTAMLLQRLRHQRADITARVAGDGGLVLRVDPRHELTVQVLDDEVQAHARIGDLEVVVGQIACPRAEAELRISVVDPSHGGPDDIVLSARVAPGGWQELGRVDGRYLSTEVAGGFTGRVFGLLSGAGQLSTASLTYSGSEAAALENHE